MGVDTDNGATRPNHWEQYFPTYDFRDRDIVLKEYDVSANALGLEERLFSMASSITVIAGTAVASIAVGKIPTLKNNHDVMFFTFVFTLFISYITVKYFAGLYKSVVFSSRKIIVLRRMLGLQYGPVRLVLPNWRVEGADEPFSVHMFPGWFSHAAYPFYIISFLSSILIFFSMPISFPDLSKYVLEVIDKYNLLEYNKLIYPGIASSIWFFFLLYIFRRSLFDYHESESLLITKMLSNMLYIKIPKNFEYIIYRGVLSTYEIKRLKIDTDNIHKICVFREDRSFFKHFGFSGRGIFRAFSLFIRTGKKTGGSTLTQQLVRTLFICYPARTWARKIIEIFFAVWIERHINKDQILNMYIASVRYDDGVYGLPAAMTHFLGDIIINPTKSQSFVLVERISNISKRFNGKAVETSLRDALELGVMTREEAISALKIYDRLISKKIITSIVEPSPTCIGMSFSPEVGQ